MTVHTAATPDPGGEALALRTEGLVTVFWTFHSRVRHVNRASRSELTELLVRVSGADHVAFASLHTRLRPVLLDRLAAVPLDAADVIAVADATFVEVWWLAPRWPGGQTDALAWVCAIAARRGAERRTARVAGSTQDAEPIDVFTSLDRQVGLELGLLLTQSAGAGHDR